MENETVWIQNLKGFIEGKFPADEKWKMIFIEKLSMLDSRKMKNVRMLDLYADSYEAMSRYEDGKVSASDVAYDIRSNMIKQLVHE